MKPSGPWLLLGGSFSVNESVSVLVTGLFIFSISSWFSLGRLYLSKNLFTSSKLSVLLTHQFSSVAQSHPTLCEPINCSTPGFPVHHQLPEFAQTHVHLVCNAIQPARPLLSPSPPALNLSQHQGLFQWVSSLHHVAKVLEFQLQHQSFQWTHRTDFL